MAAAALLVAGIAVAAVAAGWNVHGWLTASWSAFTAVSLVYLVPTLALQTLEVAFAAAAWYGIVGYAYAEAELSLLPVLACYATGIAPDCFLPASAGTLVTILMLVATIDAARPAGVVAAAAVEKLFYAAIGGLVWVYLFFSVGGSFQRRFGFVTAHPWATALVAATALLVLAAGGRLLWRRLRRQWEQAKQGGKILSDRRAYVRRVLVPQLLGWCARLGTVAVLLTAYGIPIDFHAVASVVAGNSLAGVASVTRGGIGVSQVFNVASLHGVTGAATATAYSIGQQLLTTVWSVVLAVVHLGLAFGPSRAKHLVKQSYADARAQRNSDTPLTEA